MENTVLIPEDSYINVIDITSDVAHGASPFRVADALYILGGPSSSPTSRLVLLHCIRSRPVCLTSAATLSVLEHSQMSQRTISAARSASGGRWRSSIIALVSQLLKTDQRLLNASNHNPLKPSSTTIQYRSIKVCLPARPLPYIHHGQHLQPRQPFP